MTTDHLTRQADLIPLSVLTTPITVVGAGAVGSFTVLSLAKMGFTNITVYDDDVVSVENMNCQFYRFSDIGLPKVQALASLVEDFVGVEIATHNEQATSSLRPAGILITAVDSMAARSMLWETNQSNGRLTLYVDPRMSAEIVAVRAIVPGSREARAYPASLYSDEDAMTERCTAKATMYTSLLISGHVCSVIKQALCNPTHVHAVDYDIAQADCMLWSTGN